MSRLVHLSALAALGLTPEVKGHRITGSTMPQIVDAKAGIERRGTTVCVCVFAFV